MNTMNQLSTTAMLFKSLGDETRLSIVRKLAGTAHTEVNSRAIVNDCALALELSQPTMSYHFQTLVAAGVLQERKVGVEKYYQLNHQKLQAAGIDVQRL